MRLVTETLYARHPEWDARWGPRGREATARDVDHNLLFLEASLRTGDARVFARYSAWTAGVLRAHRVPVEALTESYDVTADALAARLAAPEAERARTLLREGAAATAQPAPVPGAWGAARAHPDSSRLLDAVLAGDRRAAQAILGAALEGGMTPAQVGDRLVQPAMAEVGRLWQEHRISVADEHLATATLQTALVRAMGGIEAAAPHGRKALLACVEGNHHAVGLRIVADAFETAGWEIAYLGADVPTRDLVRRAKERRPDLVGLSLSLPSHVATARVATDALREAFGAECPTIVVGGLPLNDFEGLHSVVGADVWYPDVSRAVEGHP